VILGARNATHIPDHLALFDFSLDDADRDSIARVLAGGEQPTQDAYTWERGGKW
jgi:diketogulonate reductase-like aldo/keto reductase